MGEKSTQPSENDLDASGEPAPPTAAEALLRSLGDHGVKYLFANLGTDHTPLLEASARIREQGDANAMPEFIVCPHEFVAMSAAHGYAMVTGDPQAVLVHVDVGTQNLGAAVHNAHRANAPVFVIAGLAPVTDAGYAGSRDHTVHYIQDVFDQPGIVRQYCRWMDEYHPPADPDALVTRGLERAATPPAGPVYLTAGREALESREYASGARERDAGGVTPAGADAETVRDVANRVDAADSPLVITSKLGARGMNALVEFAETTGAGVVEHGPIELSFPRDHDLHVGFDPTAAFDHADLVLAVAVDVPWVPSRGGPAADTPVIQLDTDPTKGAYPHWDFPVDRTVRADPVATLESVTSEVTADPGSGRRTWSEVAAARREREQSQLAEHRGEDRLTPEVLSAAVDDIVDDSTIVIDDAVTNSGSVLSHLDLSQPGSYFSKGGSGLGWAGGAAVGAKLAQPDSRVIALVGDGAHVFSNPTACAWLAAAEGAPTLTVIYDNAGWNAVKRATKDQHPEGVANKQGVIESEFDGSVDLSAAASAVDAYSRKVETVDALSETLDEAIQAVDSGRPAVLDVKLEPI